MFEDEEMAANVDDGTDINVDTKEQSTPPVEDNGAKAYSERLKKDREKIRNEERENLAKSFGYNTWNEYLDATTNNKLLDNGLDPDYVRPVLKDLIKNDPDYLEAMKYKAEKEELELKLFANNSLQELNNTFGTNYKSIDELDSDTIDMWNKGTALTKAYAANNWTKIQESAVKKATKISDNGKSHLKDTTGSNQTTETKNYSKEELDVFGMFGISAEKANEWKKSHENK